MSPATLERKVVGCRWKADASGALVGYASTFGNVDLGGDVVERGAFTDAVASIRAQGIPLLADHVPMTAAVLGTIYDASEDERGLVIRARFASTRNAQDTRTLLAEGHVSNLSIGYEATRYRFEDRDGRQVRVLEAVELWETSVVVFPMNTEATVQGVKSSSGLSVADLDLRLVAAEVEVLRLLH